MTKTAKMIYVPTTRVVEQIDRVFNYHPPRADLDQVERYKAIRAHAREFAWMIVQLTPVSREQSTALTKLEETVMFANAAIARTEANAEYDDESK